MGRYLRTWTSGGSRCSVRFMFPGSGVCTASVFTLRGSLAAFNSYRGVACVQRKFHRVIQVVIVLISFGALKTDGLFSSPIPEE